MQCTFTVRRSEGFVRARRLETGNNVPVEICVKVEIAHLVQGAREVLLGDSGYSSHWTGRYDSDYHWLSGHNGMAKGSLPLAIDSDEPTPDEVSAALLAAYAALTLRRDQAEAEKAERQRQETERQRQETERQAKRAEARELLKDELARLERERAEARTDRHTLAEFLAEIPGDALRGTLKRLAHSPEAVAALRQKIENASPVFLFEEDEYEDE